MARAGKGSKFEREIAKVLSRWWTQNWEEPRQDIFWRTSGSGARATTRAKKNLQTTNSSGDLMALDPIGLPFLKVFCTELKNGYSRFTIADLLDKPEKGAQQQYEKWFTTAERDRQRAGSLYWLLIVKRDHRQPLVFLPAKCEGLLKTYLAEFYLPGLPGILCLSLESFLKDVSPGSVKQLASIK